MDAVDLAAGSGQHGGDEGVPGVTIREAAAASAIPWLFLVLMMGAFAFFLGMTEEAGWLGFLRWSVPVAIGLFPLLIGIMLLSDWLTSE